LKPPRRGEIWLVDLNPTKGHEQAGVRPAVVVSDDVFNAGPADLCIVVPVTSRLRPIPSQIRLPASGGLDRPSAALCEGIRSVSRSRLIRRIGSVGGAALASIDDILRILIRL
jgi:mRNA interferase MazF